VYCCSRIPTFRKSMAVTIFVSLHLEDGGNTILRNVGILSQHYTASQPRRTRLETENPQLSSRFCENVFLRDTQIRSKSHFFHASNDHWTAAMHDLPVPDERRTMHPLFTLNVQHSTNCTKVLYAQQDFRINRAGEFNENNILRWNTKKHVVYPGEDLY
jgi:hypothetical protein